LEEHALDRIARAEVEHLLVRRLDQHLRRCHGGILAHRVHSRAMPIHIRADPGDYAEAVLLPGDPLRAKYLSETYLEDAVQRNSERGLLGYRRTYDGKPGAVQGAGAG